MSIQKSYLVNGCCNSHIELLAGEVFPKASGYLINIDSSTGKATKTVAADTVISGFADIGFLSDDSDVSSDVLTVVSTKERSYRFCEDPSMVVRMPLKSGETLAVTHSGLLCDIDITSNVQSVTTAATSTVVVQILSVNDQDIALNAPRVRINPAKFGRS